MRASRRTVSLGGGLRVQALPPRAVDATHERLRHALRDGQVGEEGGARRLSDPFDTLRQRRKLDPVDMARNDLLWQAGERFRRHWHGARLDGLSALDIQRESVDGGGRGTTPTEAALRHRQVYHRACAAVGERLLPCLAGIVIEGHPLAALVHLVGETAHRRTAEAIVAERMREALHRLVDHWGLAAGMAPRRRPAVSRRRPSPG